MTDLLSSVFSISTHTSICVNHRVSEDGVVGHGGLWWVMVGWWWVGGLGIGKKKPNTTEAEQVLTKV